MDKHNKKIITDKILKIGTALTALFWIIILVLYYIEYNMPLAITILLYLVFCLVLNIIIYMRFFRKYKLEDNDPSPRYYISYMFGSLYVGVAVFIMAYPLTYLLK